MNEYLLLFWNEAGPEGYEPSPEELKQGMQAWQSWIGTIAASGKLISTKPIQFEGTTISRHGIDPNPARPSGKMVTGYLLCRRTSQEEVARWAEDCPIQNYPGGFTEVRQIAPFEL